MQAIIYRPAKTAMQSGRAKAKRWIVEFDAETARRVEPLMGWTGSADMRQQLRLEFESEAAARAYCERHDIAFELRAPRERRVRPKSYSENFSPYSVRGPGTDPISRP
jgi:hypothetical protein